MTLQDRIRADLEREEGRVRHVYLDSEGYWTIGVGILVDERKGGGLYDEEIDFIRDNRIKRLTKELNERMPQYRLYSENIRHALFMMSYQMGVSGLLAFKQMIAALDAEDYQAAATAALESKWARQTPARAARVSALIREG